MIAHLPRKGFADTTMDVVYVSTDVSSSTADPDNYSTKVVRNWSTYYEAKEYVHVTVCATPEEKQEQEEKSQERMEEPVWPMPHIPILCLWIDLPRPLQPWRARAPPADQ